MTLLERSKKSRAAAVKLFCRECLGGVREDIKNCTATACPLYKWRPYQVSRIRVPRQDPAPADADFGGE